jgi:hypothetical protein
LDLFDAIATRVLRVSIPSYLGAAFTGAGFRCAGMALVRQYALCKLIAKIQASLTALLSGICFSSN